MFIDLDRALSYVVLWFIYDELTFCGSQTICITLQEFLAAVTDDAKVLPALRDQLAKLEITVKHL